jgi:hypothetical protein
MDPSDQAILDGLQSFTWDGRHVLLALNFVGAPAAPNPASIYNGRQLILIKTDGTTFAGGDAWKCLSCGVPAANKVGLNDPNDMSYPEAFRDEKRVKFGKNILECDAKLIDAACTPANTHIYPIKSPFPAFPSGGILRETRLHPDNVHLGWNQLYFGSGGALTQFGVFGKLTFNQQASPPGYELSNVHFMLSKDLDKTGRFISVKKPGELSFDDTDAAGVIGEFRGFSPDGQSALGIGTQDSFNYDIFGTSLENGKSDRLSSDPAYTDPVNMSPDGKSIVLMDGRVDNRTGYPDGYPLGDSGRTYFASAAPGVPPLIDLAISEAIGAFYNNEFRRFFEPVLINVNDPDSNIHDGQILTQGGDTTPGNGSISDPLWNSGANPAWSPDGTAVVFYQRLVRPPACDSSPTADAGPNTNVPKPTCPVSHEPGGRFTRLMIAKLADRKPQEPQQQPQPVNDAIPWGTPYKAGDPLPPVRPEVPAGTYTLKGKKGSADVVITHAPSPFNPGKTVVVGVKVTYKDYSADGVNVINGTEEATKTFGPPTQTWHENLTLSGLHKGTRKTSEPGGFVVQEPQGAPPVYTGTLTTTLDGKTFESPVTGG